MNSLDSYNFLILSQRTTVRTLTFGELLKVIPKHRLLEFDWIFSTLWINYKKYLDWVYFYKAYQIC